MKLFIPPLGTKIILTEDWNFRLFYEYRNYTLMRMFNLVPQDQNRYTYYGRSGGSANVKLEKGTKLTVDRIYIRKGSKDFDSVTFWLGEKPKGIGYRGKVRFWVKLSDANNIECEKEESNG